MQFNSIHIVPKLNEPDCTKVRDVIATITTVAHKLGIRIVDIAKIKPSTLVIGAGGDGTMLAAMRIAANTNATVLGINLGKVGFLTDFSANDLTNLRGTLFEIFSNSETFPHEKRIAINIERKTDSNHYVYVPAFNEYAIHAHNDSIITYQLQIGDMYAGEHQARSLLLSAPTGSTAYSLSAGGGLLLPSMEVFQIIPVAPLSITSRPIIVPSKLPIKVKVHTYNTLSVRADGQEILKSDDPLELTFIEHPHSVRVLHNKEWNFFTMLTNKLGWKQG